MDYGATVLRVCRAILGPHADADDAWSETFLAALQAWPQLPENTNIEAWLVRVAHNKAIDITRRQSRQAIPTDQPPDQVSTIGKPDEGYFEIWAAVNLLSPKQRQAIAYHYLAGLPYADVAEIIGITTAAARRAAADGIKKLRQHPLFTERSTL